MRRLYVILMAIFLVACSSFDPENKIDEINNSDHYTINSTTYNTDNTKEITIEIKKDNSNLIFIYYQENNKSNNFIIYYNQDNSIPVKQCYIIEPLNVPSIEKQAYIEYIDELNKQYDEELLNMGITNKQLLQIIEYYYNS